MTQNSKKGGKKYTVVFSTTTGDKRQIYSISGDNTETPWPRNKENEK